MDERFVCPPHLRYTSLNVTGNMPDRLNHQTFLMAELWPGIIPLHLPEDKPIPEIRVAESKDDFSQPRNLC